LEYGDKVLDHFEHPRNVGEMQDPDGTGEFGDPGCGDTFWVYIRVKDGRIDDISFQIHGCPAAIACGSALTEMARGKTLDEALRIRNEDVLAALGGLPDPKEHCSNLGAEALHRAVFDYLARLTPTTAWTFWVQAVGEVSRVAEVGDDAPPGFPRLAEIVVFPRFTPALEGVEESSHFWIAYWMHELPPEERAHLKGHPKGDRSRPERGVFALRSPHRPNPVGWSLVRLVSLRGHRLLVDGLDARPGTPVLDIKPWSAGDAPGPGGPLP
jgi:nitrogen fixation NifU-like protein